MVYICSIRIIKNISFYLAGFILILHSLMPHQHHSEISDGQNHKIHQQASSVSDFMQLFLHIDMGDGHLEHFDNATDIGLDLQAVSVFIPSTLLPLQDFQLVTECNTCSILLSIAETVWIPKDRYLITNTLRGPPNIS